MNRRSILSISAMTVLGLAVLPGSAVAQQKTLKELLVGTWTLVSYDATPANGTKERPDGANPRGMLIFEAGGRYAIFFERPDRPKYKNPIQPTTEELVTTQQGFGGNFGTWSVSEADKTVTRRFEGSLNPNNEGMDLTLSVTLAGDELKLTGVDSPSTGGTQVLVYRRAR